MKNHPQNQLFSKDNLIDDSIALMQANPEGQPWQLCFSGGKDSIVMLKLAQMAGIEFTPVMYLTGMDIPEIISVTKYHYPTVIFKKAVNYWKLLKNRGLPSIRYRWCCCELKEHVGPGFEGLLIGIRAEESVKRKHYPEINISRKKLCIYPILHWPAWAIWEFIDDYKLPYPEKIYSLFDRTGCVVCPFRNYKDHMRYKELFPQTYRMFEKCAKYWWDSRIEAGKVPIRSFDDAMEEWYRSKGMITYWERIIKDEDLV